MQKRALTQKIIYPFAQFQAKTARVPAMLLLLIYVAMIPAFAFVYNLVAQEFYHTTAKYEADILADGWRIHEGLEAAVEAQFSEYNSGPTKMVGDWLVDIRELNVSQASFEEGQLVFQTYMRFKSDNGTMMGGPRVFRFDAHPSIVMDWLSSDNQRVIKLPIGDGDSRWPVSDGDIFQLASSGDGMSGGSGLLVLSMELQDRITALDNSFKGFPSNSSGAYGRLLYFSAVTQTTLGFGDIVPISDRTRLLVGFQSVLGIVFIGLFLNSLTGLVGRSLGPSVPLLYEMLRLVNNAKQERIGSDRKCSEEGRPPNSGPDR